MNIATGGLDGKIVIRSLEENFPKIKEITLDLKIEGLVWDTYDKYLAALNSNNHVICWKTNTWEKETDISLNFPNSQSEK